MLECASFYPDIPVLNLESSIFSKPLTSWVFRSARINVHVPTPLVMILCVFLYWSTAHFLLNAVCIWLFPECFPPWPSGLILDGPFTSVCLSFSCYFLVPNKSKDSYPNNVSVYMNSILVGLMNNGEHRNRLWYMWNTVFSSGDGSGWDSILRGRPSSTWVFSRHLPSTTSASMSKFPLFIRASVILEWGLLQWQHLNLIIYIKTISPNKVTFWGTED